MSEPIRNPPQVAAVAEEIRTAGRFSLDLEFVSESRFIPELGLVQLAWGSPEAPRVAAVDPLAVDPRPVLELVADPAVETILHAAQGDLSLLAQRFDLAGRRVLDAQIAAGFLGLGDQIGYTGLVQELFGVTLDKGPQFTDWLRRPLSAEQMRYALDDVRYLLPAWVELERRLAERGRLAWVEEESARLAETAARPLSPEDAYLRVRGWERLRPQQLGALRQLAAWRLREAVTSNRPPSWILKDRSMVELARKPPRDPRGLSEVRGVRDSTVSRYGEEILAALRSGGEGSLPGRSRQKPLPQRARTWAVLVAGLVQARCREAGVPHRFVGSRDDVESLVRWWMDTDREREPSLELLQGWRRELAGEAALDWLAGRAAIAVARDSESGIRLLPEPGGTEGGG